MTIYVDSGATGTNTGADWTNAYLKIASAAGAAVAGEIVYVASRHVEDHTGANLVLTWADVWENPVRVISVQTNTTTYETMVTQGTGQVNTLASWNLEIRGCAAFYGMRFATASGQLQPAVGVSERQTYYQCRIAGGGIVQLGSSIAELLMEACEVSQTYNLYGFRLSGICRMQFINTTFTINGTVTTHLFDMNADGIHAEFDACNLTAVPSNLALSETTATDNLNVLRFRNCKLAPGYTVAAAPGCSLLIEQSHSGTTTATHNGLVRNGEYGGQISQTNADYRNTGANDGENSYSWLMAPNANVNYYTPLTTNQRMAIWHDASGNKTLTLYLVGPVSMTNANIWINYATPSEAGVADYQWKWGTTRAAPGSTGTALQTDASTWTGPNTSTATKYKIVVPNINPTEPGPVYVRCSVGSNNQFYICPKLELT